VLPCCLGWSCRIPLFVCGWRVLPPAPVVLTPPPDVVPPPPAAIPGPIVSVPSPLPPSAAPAVKALVPAPPMTHHEFAQVFKPLPGKYEVSLIHPGSKCPVTVCFTLPEGCPQVKVHRRDLVFDYGRHEVHIRFALGGRVKVTAR
jgi:hypothetical protein